MIFLLGCQHWATFWYCAPAQGDDRWNCQRSYQGQGWLWSCSKCTPSSFSSAWSSSTALTSASTSPPSSSMYTKIFPWWAIHQETASKMLCTIWGVSLVIRLPDPFAGGSSISNWSGNLTMGYVCTYTFLCQGLFRDWDMKLMWQMFTWILPNLVEYCSVVQFIFFNVPHCDFATADSSKHHAVCFM